MGSFSLAHWVAVLAIILILFGAGRSPRPWATSRAACACFAPVCGMTTPPHQKRASWPKRLIRSGSEARVFEPRFKQRASMALICPSSIDATRGIASLQCPESPGPPACGAAAWEMSACWRLVVALPALVFL
jgi:hypothetical protein